MPRPTRGADPTAVPTRPNALTAFRLARHHFIEGRRWEMQELAAELGVNRATLFRWVGNRDDLIADIVWSVTEPTLAAAVAGAKGSGGGRIASALAAFAAAANRAGGFQAFVQREPERALRILTTRAGPFQRRLIEKVESLVREEVESGALNPPLPVHDLAYLLVRIAETFIYSNMIIGEPADALKVEQATTALLR